MFLLNSKGNVWVFNAENYMHLFLESGAKNLGGEMKNVRKKSAKLLRGNLATNAHKKATNFFSLLWRNSKWAKY